MNTPASFQREQRALFGVLAAALLLRALVVWLLPEARPFGDQNAYLRGAREILEAGPYLQTRGPAYSAFIATCQLVWGHDAMAARVGNILLGTLTVLATWWLGRQLFSTRAGLWAAACAAIHPRFVTMPLYLLSENLYVLCVVAGLGALLHAVRTPSARWVVASGLCFGVGILTREQLVYFVVALPILIGVAFRRDRRFAARQGLLLLAVASAVVLPWTLRNLSLHDELILVGYSSGVPLFEGNYRADTRREIVAERQRQYRGFLDESGGSRVAADRKLRAAAWEIIRERQPAWAFEKLAENGPQLIQPDVTQPQPWVFVEPEASSSRVRLLTVASFIVAHFLMLTFAALGFASWRWDRPEVLVVFFLLFSLAVHLVANAGLSRFLFSYEWTFLLAIGSLASVGLPRARASRLVAAGLLGGIVVSQGVVLERWSTPYDPELSATGWGENRNAPRSHR